MESNHSIAGEYNERVNVESEESESLVELDRPPRKRKRQSKTTNNVGKATNSTAGRRVSPYHAHFQKCDEVDKVECKYCSKRITHKSGNGTSALKTHTERCKMFPANLDRKQKLIEFECQTIDHEDGTTEIVKVPKLWLHDQLVSRKECAKMLIIDELPFALVEGVGFRGFCKALNPEFVPPSRSTVTRDCYSLFIDERAKLKEFFSKLSSRVCLTTDTWTSGQNLSYMCLTGHFIDDDWKLHKRILNFCPIAGHSGEVIGRSVEQCLIEWNLKKNLTCTVDNASANDVAIQYLKRRVNFWKGTVLEGKYMHMRCAAHILNLIVKDGLKKLDVSILRVRFAVMFVRASPARAKAFKACVNEVNIKSKGLVCLDVETRWNSTFLMLQSALKFKEAFSNLSSKGGAYTRYMNKHHGVPDDNDWEAVETFLPFLEIFYNATLKVSGSLYSTSNTFIPLIAGVGSLISSYCDHENEQIRSMSLKMKAKHDKYWADIENVNVLLFVVVILDPRHKWVFVEWTVTDAFDDESANMLLLTIKKCLKALFESYDTSALASASQRRTDEACSSSKFVSPTPIRRENDSAKKIDAEHIFMERYKNEKRSSVVVEKKSELEKYLSDDKEPDDPGFDLLGWWKDSSKRRYPTLAKLAKDVLAMPISTVASESSFSTGGRVLDSFRTSLTPRLVEALICSQDWFRQSHGPLIIEENLADLEDLEERMKDLLIQQQPEILIDESMVVSFDDDGFGLMNEESVS